MNPDTTNDVIDLSPPVEWLYKCDCPKCISGMHYNKDVAESYRRRGTLERELSEKTNEVERIRERLARAIEIAETVGWTRQTTYLAEMKRELHKIKEEARLAPAPEEPVSECPVCKGTGEYCAGHSSGGASMEPCFNPSCTATAPEEPAPDHVVDWRELRQDETQKLKQK